jgi:DNA modification methylase
MIDLKLGDCLEVLATMEDNSVDSIVTDPPYGIAFMQSKWDYGVPSVDIWKQCLRVLKPGGHLLAFAGTRTQHRMAVNIEDAGFEIRDMIAWLYGSGFPKSHNINKALGDSVCLCRGSALPYTHEKEVSREPQTERAVCAVRNADVSQAMDSGERRGQILQQSLQEQSSSAFNKAASDEGLSQSSLERRSDSVQEKGQLHGRDLRQGTRVGEADGAKGRLCDATPSSDGGDVRLPVDQNGSGQSQGPQSQQQRSIELGALPNERGSQAGRGRQICGKCGKPMVPEGLGTALKPALEPITVARKPFKGTVANNVLEHGTGAINIDGCRVGTDESLGRPYGGGNAIYGKYNMEKGTRTGDGLTGRWPANLIHDGSDEVTELFPQAVSGGAITGEEPSSKTKGILGEFSGRAPFVTYNDSGSAARFFYCPKCSKKDRDDGNTHPTVKPTDLMAYLCRLVTPPEGVVLDPFMGSGSTGKAAAREGFSFIGIEREDEYHAIAMDRIMKEMTA